MHLPVRTRRAVYANGCVSRAAPIYSNVQWPIKFRPAWQALVDPSMGYLPTRNAACRCGTQHTVLVDGVHTCFQCAIVGQAICTEAPYRTDGARYTPKIHRYDFKNHLDRHMQPIQSLIPGLASRRIRGIFPRIYRVFFKLYPKRKNFMSYGFVLRKLLVAEGLSPDIGNLPTVKTPCKVRECEEAWRAISLELGL